MIKKILVYTFAAVLFGVVTTLGTGVAGNISTLRGLASAPMITNANSRAEAIHRLRVRRCIEAF